MMNALRTALALTAILSATQTAALSCLRPDVAHSFQRADKSEDLYRVYTGQFFYDPASVPQRDMAQRDPEDTEFPARFEGHTLSRAGFTAPVSLDITIELNCIASWCGGPPQEGEWLVFMRELADGTMAYASNACPSWGFSKPTRQQKTTVRSCARGNSCKPDLSNNR